MAKDALNTVILSLKTVRNWPYISSKVCYFMLRISNSFYSYFGSSIF